MRPYGASSAPYARRVCVVTGDARVAAMIAPARARDAAAILTLQSLCFRSEAALYEDDTIPPLTETLTRLRAAYDTHSILTARVGEGVVGSVRGRRVGGACQISRLMVHPQFQQQGLGSRLMGALEALFTTVERYELFTGQRSAVNLRLYRRLGYAPFREEEVSAHLRLVYLEKWRDVPSSAVADKGRTRQVSGHGTQSRLQLENPSPNR